MLCSSFDLNPMGSFSLWSQVRIGTPSYRPRLQTPKSHLDTGMAFHLLEQEVGVQRFRASGQPSRGLEAHGGPTAHHPHTTAATASSEGPPARWKALAGAGRFPAQAHL